MLKKTNDIEKVYELFEEAFPNSELRVFDRVKYAYEQQVIDLYGYYDDGALMGAMMVWQMDDVLFLENFAVSKDARGKGIGSKMLNALCHLQKDAKVVLEVEEPFDEMSRRRINFYKRNHFTLSSYGYMQPQINIECNDIPLVLMGYGLLIDEGNFDDIKSRIFECAYNEKYL